MTMQEKIAKFISDNFKTVVMVVTFFVGIYIQHQTNTMQIQRMQKEIVRIDSRLDAQYSKLDAMKLDKSAFEATIRQFSTMSSDIRDIRITLESLMANQAINNNNRRYDKKE